MKSRGYVKEEFSWRWYYWYLTNEGVGVVVTLGMATNSLCSSFLPGIQYLRDYLHLPQEIVPSTLKRPVKTESAKPRPRGMKMFSVGVVKCGEQPLQ